MLTDDERAGIRVALAEPFYAAQLYVETGDEKDRWRLHLTCALGVVNDPDGVIRVWGQGGIAVFAMEEPIPGAWRSRGVGVVMRDFERRTSLAAMAQLCWIRDMSASREGRVLLANRGIEPQERPT